MSKARVEINTDLCKGCELCTIMCPVKVLEMEKVNMNEKGYYPAAAVHPEKCTGCANCAIMCPDSAIKVLKI